MSLFELHPIDNRKSFYGKAHVYQENGRYILRSYELDIAEFNPITCVVTRYRGLNYYSRTSNRHFASFKQFCRNIASTSLTIIEL